ncbi:hypothetical protein CEB3_c21630 [Peptococcaceae bacterium CEB3]|nr:hypothetical protein CEB3_c21630 [Peptococcaceae bacterium CEB3]
MKDSFYEHEAVTFWVELSRVAVSLACEPRKELARKIANTRKKRRWHKQTPGRAFDSGRGRGSMATVYQVCAIVITIFLGVLGFELALALYSLRRLTEEAKRTLEGVNHQLPELLDNVQAVSRQVRKTGDLVGCGLGQAAAGIEEVKGEPLRFLASLLALVKEGWSLWQNIRSHPRDEG